MARRSVAKPSQKWKAGCSRRGESPLEGGNQFLLVAVTGDRDLGLAVLVFPRQMSHRRRRQSQPGRGCRGRLRDRLLPEIIALDLPGDGIAGELAVLGLRVF